MSSVVLVTGGSGFIGSHVVDRLAAAGHRPRIFDTRRSPYHEDVETVVGDVLSVESLEAALRGCAAVCHLAAAADVGQVHAQPAWATELNAQGTLNVLEAARRTGVERVIYASTVWVYSDVDAERVDEDTLLPNPAHLYTAGKLAGELFCRSYAELYGIKPTVLRFGIPYGPRARPAAVIPSFVDRALRGEPLTIAGGGEQERSFVYVEDLAEGVVCALRPEAAGRTFNLGGRETTTVRELAEIVCDEVAPTEIVHTEGRAGDLRGAEVCSDRADRELDWRATTPLREGVRRYAAWVRDEQVAPSAPVPAPAAARASLQRVRARLAAVAAEPIFVGAGGLVALASAVIAVILGTGDVRQAADFTVAGIALMLPVWTLTTTRWPTAMLRRQSLTAAFTAGLGVLLLGVLSARGDGEGAMNRPTMLAIVFVAVCVTFALQLLPRRLAGDAA